jgi:zinc transporter ZupT
MYPNVVSLFLMVPLTTRLPVALRVIGGFCLFLFVYIMIPTITLFDLFSKRASFIITLLLIALCGE